ncbi:MAG TPA: RNA pseudouridine synthase [Oceanospirillales bacterium]|jgi:tRNA pseudouridine32 synthase/23S rRNA pseudouridine746 synthase|nr:RNA pseudouridine synthase [Oceanospirillales bacterium]|tara:strand:- start:2573 stop:3199 length:627 start_codon:yes stop_codon:yes gene_type:complete
MNSVNILFSDNEIIIVDKAPGILSVPGRGPEKLDSVSHRLSLQFPEIHIVHRLDMATSGIMVFARNKEALRSLQQQFQNRQTEKSYQAIIAGHLTPTQGAINLPMRCDWPNRPKQMVCYEFGKKSLTRWRVMEYIAENTRVELLPFTGRSHQLRIHCDALGHPILGDNLYGTTQSQTATEQLCLHAQSLTFTHPSSEERLTFSSSAPF